MQACGRKMESRCRVPGRVGGVVQSWMIVGCTGVYNTAAVVVICLGVASLLVNRE